MKKIIVSLLILPLLFSLGSFFISQKAHAAKTLSFTGYVFLDNGAGGGTANNGRKDGSEPLYTGGYTVQADSTVNSTRNSTTFKYSLSRTTSADQVNVRLIVPSGYEATKLNYQAFVGGTAVTASVDGNSKTFSANNTVNFGIKVKPLPFCDENTTTNCQKCSSNSQCSSKANFKYCAPTTDRCSDLETWKTSVCRANNYCGTISLGSAGQLSCGGCGNGNSCNTNTNKCVTTPNCTTAVKLGKCEPKANLPQPNGASCGATSGTQTRTFTDRPGYSTCKQTATTPQNCTPTATDVCRSGLCSIGECVQCTTSNLRNCTAGQFCNSSNKCETRVLTPTQNPNQKTLTFSGYVFIDEDGNGRKGDNELFYKDPYIVQADSSINSTLTGYAYDLKRTTNASQVNVRLIIPSGYGATKLNYQDFVGGTVITASVDGNSKTFSANNTVNFGIKKVQDNTPTKDLIVSEFTFPGGVDTGTSDPIVKIKNIGNTAISGDFNVKVINRDGGASKVWTVSQVVSAGEVIDLSSKFVNMPRPAAGTHLANAFVDSAGNISETNEGNNFKTDSYTTTKPDSNPTTKPPTNPPAPTCDKNPPTLEITPNNRNGNPGDEKEYSVKITNNDQGAACDPVNFVLSKEHLPNDSWTGSFTDNTLSNIEKNGGSKSTSFKLKSPSGATEGQKTITLGLKREGQTAAQIQVNTFYTVTPNNPPTEQPTTCTRNAPEFIVTPDSLESTPGEEADYKIEITNKDTGTCSPKTLSLTAVFPNNSWQAFFGKDSPFDLAQDAKQITNVRIKSPDTATPGDKKITLNIINSNGTILASKDIAYVIPGVTPTQCVQNNPEFSITPQTKNGNPGEGVTYEMTIKNVDQSDCNSRTFSFQANPPNNDWTTNFSENSSSFAPGESKNINVTITSPSNISTGEHTTVLKLLENNSQLSSIVAVYNVEDQITPIPGNTYLNFKLGIDGIGTTPRIPIGGNKNPNNIWRRLNFRIYNTVTNTLSFTGTNITFTYNQDSEKFELLYDLPSVENLPNGSYNIYVDGPGFLTNQYPGSFSINHGQVANLTSNNFYLITGNVNNNDLSENKIDLMDYNLLLSCSTYSQDRTACDQGENNQEYTDLNDDGIVNEDDYTLFLKEFASQQGVILPD